jgi:SAM-dependent methyltransferase
MTAPRWPLSGVVRMVRFNWPDYVLAGGMVTLAGGALALGRIPFAVPGAVGVGGLVVIVAAASVAAWWIAASLVAGWWVYDRSELYRWTWVTELLSGSATRWANVTAGFDESTDALRELLGPGGTTIDLYDPERMTEASIRRARASRAPVTGTIPASPQRIPVDTGALDAAFVIFAAHELRAAADRVALFRELARAIRPEGAIVLVEHPRSAANLAAFGPGAFHFLPRREWRRVADAAGLRIRRVARMTPFVEALVLEPRR